MQCKLHSCTKFIKVFVINNNTIERAALQTLITGQEGLQVIGEAVNLSDSLAAIRINRPDIILLALNVNGDGYLDFIPELLTHASSARLLILTGIRDAEVHQRAVRLGALGLVLKDEPPETLVKAIEKIHAGEVWLDRTLTANILVGMSRSNGTSNGKYNHEASKTTTLTERERETISLLGEGLKNKEIAGRLFISESTVRHHLSSIFSKLAVSNRFDLILYAYRQGLAKPPR